METISPSSTVYVSRITDVLRSLAPAPRNRAERRAAARLTPRCPHCGRAFADCVCEWARK
jgi:hypothetical protein